MDAIWFWLAKHLADLMWVGAFLGIGMIVWGGISGLAALGRWLNTLGRGRGR